MGGGSQFAHLRGEGLTRRGSGVFEGGGETPMHTMDYRYSGQHIKSPTTSRTTATTNTLVETSVFRG